MNIHSLYLNYTPSSGLTVKHFCRISDTILTEVKNLKISIGTLSRAFDLSDEALRFYEKKGLLQPKRDEDSGYRTFERADIQRVANIRRLKNQNFSLDEIHSVYYCIDENTLQSLYEEKAADIRRQILYHQHILTHTEDAIATLSHMPELLNQPQLFSPG